MPAEMKSQDVITHAAENNSQNFKVQSKGSRLSIFRQIKNSLCSVNMGFLFIHQK
jgi:hypothetical protein